MFVTGSIPTFDGARIGRFLAGVGGAGGNVPAMGLISSWFGSRRRGFASGVGVVGSSLGLMLTGPLIPAIITQYGTDGWRISWYVLAALVLVCFVLCVLFLRNKPDRMGLAPIGESQSDTVKRQGDARASPLDWGLVYKSRVLWQLAAIYFAFGYSYITYSTFFIKYLVKEGGFTQAGAGTLWFQIGVVTTISGFFWGAVSDRWGRRLALICVFFLQGASFLSLGLSRDLPSVYFSSLLFAITAWSIPALMAAIAGDVFGARLAPAALGLVTIVFGIGQALAPYTAGAIADSTQSFSLAFIIAGIVAFLGAFGSFAMRRSFSSS
jgi:MFS family permease